MSMEVPIHQARVLKAFTRDRHIRLASLDASPLWDGVRRGHPHLEPAACACLTELLAATALLQGRTAFTERLQLLIKGAGRAKAVVADCWPDGTIRGVLDLGRPEAQDWIEAPGVLQVMRSNAEGQPYIGNLELVEGGIQVQVEHYLQSSEQIQASLTLWCDSGTGEAGGLLVELLPDCPPARLARLVQAIENLEVVPYWERTAEFLAHWVSQGEGIEEPTAMDLFYRCRCTRESLLETLRRFPAEQKADLFQGAEPMEVRCDYCGTTYPITRDDLKPEEA